MFGGRHTFGGLILLNNPYQELKDLIDTDEHQDELECRKYLKYAKEYLMKDTPIRFHYVEHEFQGYTGRSDYVISGEILDTGVPRIHAYVWELKAPQCPIFQRDTTRRLKPTRHLTDAENKLLHFFDEQRGNELFRERFGVLRASHVLLGGIIIGRNETKVSGRFPSDERRETLYRTAIDARRCMYGPSGIKLVTWDQILNQITPPHVEGQIITSDVTVEVTRSITVSSSTITTLPPRTRARAESP